MKQHFVTLFASLLVFCSYGQSNKKGSKYIYQTDADDVCLITRSEHISWIDWSADDKRIFFITPSSGTINLFEIPIDKLELTEIQDNFYVANYLLDPTVPSPVKQITFEREREVNYPICLPNSNMVAYQTNFKYSPNDFYDHDIRIYDFEHKKTRIVYKGKVELFDFIDNQHMLFLKDGDTKNILKLNIETGEVTPFFTVEFAIEAMQFEGNRLLLKSLNNVYLLDYEEQTVSKIYNRKLFATRMFLVDNELFTTFPGPATGMIDLEMNERYLFFNAQDFEPTLSNDRNFIAAISQRSLGILIKRIYFTESEFE